MEELELRFDSEANVYLPQVSANENERKANELERIANENERKANETQRIENEEQRNNNLDEMEERFKLLISDLEAEYTKISYVKENKVSYITETNNENTFKLPNEYTEKAIIDVRVNGFTLDSNSYTIDTENLTVVLNNALDEIGTSVEIRLLKLTTALVEDYDSLKAESYDDTELRERVTTLEVDNTETKETNNMQQEIITGLESELESDNVEGTNLNIQGSAKARGKIIPIASEIEQDTREGYNLVDVENNIKSLTNLTYSEDVFTSNVITGSAVTNHFIYFNSPIQILSGQTAYLKFKARAKSGSGVFSKNLNDGRKTYAIVNSPNLSTTYQEYVTKFTYTDDTNVTMILLQVEGNANQLILEVKDIMLSIDNKEYEQYGSMPSPNYPSTVKVIEGDYEVLEQNKNLLNSAMVNVSHRGVTTNFDNTNLEINGTSTGSSSMGGENLKLKAGTYTINIRYVSGEVSDNFYIRLRSDNNSITSVGKTTSNYKNDSNTTFTLTEETELQFNIYSSVTGIVFNKLKYKVQITKGENVDYNFTEHQEQKLPISLGEYKLGKMGEASNYFDISYVDENGYKKITKVDYVEEIEEQIFTGNESWAIWQTNTTGYNRFQSSLIKDKVLKNTSAKEKYNCFCNFVI